MKVRAIFFAPFRELFGADEKEIELSGVPDIRVLFDSLCNSQECRERLFDELGELRNEVSILKNGRPIQTLSGLNTELEDGDEVAIFPTVAGG
jgi:molybdopterin synthase sulfur carrier subunit